MKIEPLNLNVLIKISESQNVTEGGIIIPDSVKDRPNTGVVVAVGNGGYKNGVYISPSIYVGEKALFPKFGGTEIDIDGEKYIIIDCTEILAKVL